MRWMWKLLSPDLIFIIHFKTLDLEFPCGSVVKDLELSRLWLWLKWWWSFYPLPGNFYIPQAGPKNAKKKKKLKNPSKLFVEWINAVMTPNSSIYFILVHAVYIWEGWGTFEYNVRFAFAHVWYFSGETRGKRRKLHPPKPGHVE